MTTWIKDANGNTIADMKRWHEDAANFGWTMPEAPIWKRLPIVRHVRTWWNAYQTHRWYSAGPGMFGIRSGYDSWVLFGMWHGFERTAGRAALTGSAPGE